MQSRVGRRPEHGRRILVVDDDIDSARSLVLLLGEMGHDAVYATSGRTALEMARKQQPEVILLDVGLPDLDGSEVAKGVRDMPGCEAALIIALTGLGDEHRLRMLGAGCDAFYMKPIEPRMLEALLKR